MNYSLIKKNIIFSMKKNKSNDISQLKNSIEPTVTDTW